MSRERLTVVLSQAQGKNPIKRGLEESLAAALLMEQGLDVSIVPYLYDLGPEHTGRDEDADPFDDGITNRVRKPLIHCRGPGNAKQGYSEVILNIGPSSGPRKSMQTGVVQFPGFDSRHTLCATPSGPSG